MWAYNCVHAVFDAWSCGLITVCMESLMLDHVGLSLCACSLWCLIMWAYHCVHGVFDAWSCGLITVCMQSLMLDHVGLSLWACSPWCLWSWRRHIAFVCRDCMILADDKIFSARPNSRNSKLWTQTSNLLEKRQSYRCCTKSPTTQDLCRLSSYCIQEASLYVTASDNSL